MKSPKRKQLSLLAQDAHKFRDIFIDIYRCVDKLSESLPTNQDLHMIGMHYEKAGNGMLAIRDSIHTIYDAFGSIERNNSSGRSSYFLVSDAFGEFD